MPTSSREDFVNGLLRQRRLWISWQLILCSEVLVCKRRCLTVFPLILSLFNRMVWPHPKQTSAGVRLFKFSW